MPTPDSPSLLREQQRAFANHLRDPSRHRAPNGIEDRRLKIYRDLFFNNIEGLLRGNFPVLHSVYHAEDWTTLVRDFYRDHACHTPLFPEVAQEFLRYLSERREQGHDDPDWLLELAHYEWVELALDLDESSIEPSMINPAGDLLAGVPLPSPQAWPLAYRYAVHRIARDSIPDSAPPTPTFLLVLRDRDLRVRFKEISAALYALMQALISNADAGKDARCGRDLLATQAAANGMTDPDQQRAFISEGAAMLQQLRERDAILGTSTP